MAAHDWVVMEKIMQQYVQLLATIHETIQSSPIALPLSPAIHWKYSEWAEEGKVPSADPENLGRYVDFLVPMVYEISGSAKIRSRSLGEVTAVPTLVGISAIDFSGYEPLEDSVTALSKRFNDKSNYLGVAIYKFSTLKALYKANISVVDDDSKSNVPTNSPSEETVDEGEENSDDQVCESTGRSGKVVKGRKPRKHRSKRGK